MPRGPGPGIAWVLGVRSFCVVVLEPVERRSAQAANPRGLRVPGCARPERLGFEPFSCTCVHPSAPRGAPGGLEAPAFESRRPDRGKGWKSALSYVLGIVRMPARYQDGLDTAVSARRVPYAVGRLREGDAAAGGGGDGRGVRRLDRMTPGRDGTRPDLRPARALRNGVTLPRLTRGGGLDGPTPK